MRTAIVTQRGVVQKRKGHDCARIGALQKQTCDLLPSEDFLKAKSISKRKSLKIIGWPKAALQRASETGARPGAIGSLRQWSAFMEKSRLALPDLRSVDRMPFLPECVASLVKSMKDECQRSSTDGMYRTIKTLPGYLIPSDALRQDIERYVDHVDNQLNHTPENGAKWEAETLTYIMEMLLVLQPRQASEMAVEALGNAFVRSALRDVPSWVVRWAIDDWYRKDGGLNDKGEPYDYHWRPVPADLRGVALRRLAGVKFQVNQLRSLLVCEPLVEYTDDHRAKMLTKFAELQGTLRRT